ncbi:MAG TPA: T9SS type A sorting domain-containing protein [Bacteroidales bacterium]|nr:T9SS type A sorting domain-containing protein [Bacteroidales bacterium]
MKRSVNLLFFLSLFVNIHSSFGQAGNLDPTFGDGGKVITDIGNKDNYAQSSLLTADGSILTGGFSVQNNLYNGFLVKYKNTGSIDSTFGNNGIVTCNTGTESNSFYAIAIQSDGKVVAAGKISNDIMLLRYHANGTPDSSFGNNGLVRTHIMPDQNVAAMEILSDGKMLVSARIYNGANQDFGLLRYNADGTLDNSFGNNGVVISDLTSAWELTSAMKVQADGKIVIAGRVYSASYSQSKCIIARYHANGSADYSFGTNGITITDAGQDGFGAFTNLAFQNDGKIIAVGYTIEDAGGSIYDNKSLTVRYTADGLPDPAFGTGGIVLTETMTGSDIAWSVCIQTDGKILVGGYASVGYPDWQSYFSLIRYDGQGLLDPTFFMVGIVHTYFSDNETNAAYSLLLQNDGKLVLAGITGQDSVDSKDIALARFVNDDDYSVQNNFSTASWSIYPNPSGGLFTIENYSVATACYTIKIYNTLGIQVAGMDLQSEKTLIDLHDLPKGIYFIKTDLRNQGMTKKIVIE